MAAPCSETPATWLSWTFEWVTVTSGDFWVSAKGLGIRVEGSRPRDEGVGSMASRGLSQIATHTIDLSTVY